MLTIALAGLDAETFLYVDDIIIFGCSIQHHNNNLRKVFERLRQYNLKLNPQKCNFLQTEVIYLGHLITNEGVKTDPKKFETISNYPIPINADEVKRFTAFCNYYRRFIPNFAEIAKPLNMLTRKNIPFQWTEECQNSFNTLKQKLINPPVLQYPDFTKPFVLTTDASNYALGAVLSQGEVGKDLPISYASRTLDKHELKKPIIEKELLGIYWAIKHFRPYLYGRKFLVVTDHRPLVSLFTHKDPSSKMTRIRLELSEYNFEIIYKKGALNTNADALSRIKLDSNALKEMIPTMKINMMTRSKAKEMKSRDNKENIESAEELSDQLFIHECTSISEIRNIKQLKFIKVKNVQERKKYTHAEYSDNPNSNRNSVLEKLALKKNNIYINKKEVSIEYSDNPKTDLGTILEKLTHKMIEHGIEKLALSKEEEILKRIGIKEFKEIYNNLQIKINEKRKRNLRIIIFNPPRRILEKEEQLKLIKEYHDTPHAGGHSGIKRTINKIKQKYCWKNLGKMVKAHVNNCEKCKCNKLIRHTKERLMITDTPNHSFETIEIDTVGPLMESNGYRYILTCQCQLSKYIETFPMKQKTAHEIAKILVEKLILKYGSFRKLKSDMGTEFVNSVMAEICKIFKIEQTTSTPFHHETLGSIERSHRVLNEYLLSISQKDEWDQWLPYFTFCYNITPHTETGISPFELIFGKKASLPTDTNIDDTRPIYNVDDYAKELKFRLQQSNRIANSLLQRSKIKRKETMDKNVNPLNVKIGDKVLLRVGNRRKNEPPYKGPYIVTDTNRVNSKIKIGEHVKEIHNNRLKKY